MPKLKLASKKKPLDTHALKTGDDGKTKLVAKKTGSVSKQVAIVKAEKSKKPRVVSRAKATAAAK